MRGANGPPKMHQIFVGAGLLWLNKIMEIHQGKLSASHLTCCYGDDYLKKKTGFDRGVPGAPASYPFQLEKNRKSVAAVRDIYKYIAWKQVL